MHVKLDANGRPVAWADDDRLDGDDIPCPPDPADEHRWDGSEWVRDPPPGPSDMTDAELADALRSRGVSSEEALAYLLDAGRI